MKKFIDVKSGKEIKLGDEITLMFEVNTPFGLMNLDKIVSVTKNVLTRLVADKKVKIVDDKYAGIWDAALAKLLKKASWDINKLNDILGTIEFFNPWAVAQIILKEIAVELDKKYPDSINKSKEIYVISPQDGKIHKLDKQTIKYYRTFPAFRSVKDAEIALSLIKKNLKSLFNG